ncbi:MAG: ArsC family reductase [Rhodospirillales bacterium]|nr:ArsC family reductase [Rhodospirillales bacterium]
MITLYGLKNCDTCRKARKWLEAEGIESTLHDLRADGLQAAMLDAWVADLGWETLLNRRGTTWRKLSDADKDAVDEAKVKRLMLAHPALIKRPVFDLGGSYLLGFGDAERQALKAALA